VTLPRTLLAFAVAAFGAGMGSLAALQHRAFTSGRFDLGNLTQAVWSTANGDFLQMTGLRGAQISRLGAHFDPIVAALAPLWWLWPDPVMLVTVQTIAVAAGALPVFLLARKHLGSEWAGLGFALVYLLYPPTQWLVVDDFHPVALAAPLLLAAIWFLDEGRLLPFTVVAGLACLTKEQVGLTVAMLGLWHALAHGRRRAGGVIAVAGAVVAIVAAAVVVPRYAPGGGSPFADRYSAVGGSPLGILETSVTHPLRVLEAAFEHRDLSYLKHLVLPVLGLPLLAPLLAATALPELALNVLSSTRTQTSIHFHYTATAIPGLVAASVLGAAHLQRRRPSLGPGVVRLAVVASAVAGLLLGPLPVWRHVPFGETLATRDHVVDNRARVRERALRLIPDDAPVSATNTFGAHLSERRRIFSFPVLREARWIIVDRDRPSYLDRAVAPGQFSRALARLRSDSAWTVVMDEDGVLVLHRQP
jgi:uncharacterized membrane protein